MIKHLDSTTAAKIAATLVDIRKEAGSPTMGAVLTLVIETDERHHYYALRAAREASRAHPSRILVVIPHPEQPFSGLDAEVRVGDEMGPGEAVVMRLNGELSDHADAVVLPLLLPDTPVVVWWPGDGPAVPAEHPLGKLAQRRITDAAYDGKLRSALTERLAGYVPGDTDLAWTRCTPWRSMLAAALDQMPTKVTGVSVTAERDNMSAEILAVWLGWRLGVPVARAEDDGPGITGVHLDTPTGQIALTRADGHLAVLTMPGQPDRHVALKRRESAELLGEELRRLDQDDIYAEVLSRVATSGVEQLNVEPRQPAALASVIVPADSAAPVTAEFTGGGAEGVADGVAEAASESASDEAESGRA